MTKAQNQAVKTLAKIMLRSKAVNSMTNKCHIDGDRTLISAPAIALYKHDDYYDDAAGVRRLEDTAIRAGLWKNKNPDDAAYAVSKAETVIYRCNTAVSVGIDGIAVGDYETVTPLIKIGKAWYDRTYFDLATRLLGAKDATKLTIHSDLPGRAVTIAYKDSLRVLLAATTFADDEVIGIIALMSGDGRNG